MKRWTVNSWEFDPRRVAAGLKHFGPQWIEVAGAGYTLIGLIEPDRAVAVPDHSATPIMVRLSNGGSEHERVVHITRASDQLEPKYASSLGDLVQRLAEQGDQTQFAFKDALNDWLDFGLLAPSGLTTKVIALYNDTVPAAGKNARLLASLGEFEQADKVGKLVDTTRFRLDLLQAIQQIVYRKVELAEQYAGALSAL
jgi:hypothetical protein